MLNVVISVNQRAVFRQVKITRENRNLTQVGEIYRFEVEGLGLRTNIWGY